MTFNRGDLLFTTRGIVEVDGYYQEDDLNKIRFWLHNVNSADGVTATGDAMLMSTTPGILQSWIDQFPRDIAERRKATNLANMHDILNRIDIAIAEGPTVSTRRVGGNNNGAA